VMARSHLRRRSRDDLTQGMLHDGELSSQQP
jgi:hypothetical protein